MRARINDDQIDFLIKHPKRSSKWISQQTGLSPYTIMYNKRKLGIKPPERKVFSFAEKRFMIENKSKGYSYVAKALGRNKGSVSGFYISNSLVKSKRPTTLDLSAAKEEFNALIFSTYQGLMFKSAYKRIKLLNSILNHGQI